MAKKFNLNFIRIIIILVCLGILATYGKDVFIRHFFNERLTVIPDVMNLNEKDAVRYLKKAGLHVKVIHSKTEKVPLNTVFIQDPAPQKEVKVHRTVRIWVNNGQTQKVPNIVGLELLEARSMLREKNIQIETIDYYPSNQKYNTILGVYPKPGTVLEMNQKISILVSSQKVLDPSVVPNLIGLDLNDAKVLLNQSGLQVGNISKTQDTTLPVNTIISTSPEAGTRIQKGQKINIVINAGVQRRRQTPSVEDIVNKTKKQVNEKEIENVINNTIDQIDQVKTNKDSNSNNNGNNNNNQSSDTNDTNKKSRTVPEIHPSNKSENTGNDDDGGE